MTNTTCAASVVGSTNGNTSTANNIDETAAAAAEEDGGVYLPDPSFPKFGMRASRWARDIPMDNSRMLKIADDPEEQFEVIIGVCNVIGQPRHMELDIRIHRVKEKQQDATTTTTRTATQNSSSSSSSSLSSSLNVLTTKLSSLTSSLGTKKKKNDRDKNAETPPDGNRRPTAEPDEPVYILNAYMGGMFSRYHWVQPAPKSKTKTTINEYLQQKFWAQTSSKTRAPLAIDVNVKDRIYGFYFKRYIFAPPPQAQAQEHRHIISAVEFQHLLKNFLRWGYVIGKTEIFKFQPFFFVNKYSQECTNSIKGSTKTDTHNQNPSPDRPTNDLAPNQTTHRTDEASDRTDEADDDDDDEEHPDEVMRYINCQGSVAMSALWWFQELDRVHEQRRPQRESTTTDNTNTNKYQENVDVISTVLAPLVFPRLTVRQFRGIRIGQSARKITQLESQQQLQEFLVGAGVQRAVTSPEFTPTAVTHFLHDQQPPTTMDDDDNEYNDRRESIHAGI